MFLPIFWLNLQSTGSSASGTFIPALLRSAEAYTCEFRVRFPLAGDTAMLPTELSGALFTLTSGSASTGYCSVWYEKTAAAALTGNIYLTSSAGRLSLNVQPIFDDNFYNVALVKEILTGSYSLTLNRCEDGELVYASSASAIFGTTGAPSTSDYLTVELGSSTFNPSRGQFWGQEFRLWSASLDSTELLAHAQHFESYGRNVSYQNMNLRVHWRLADGGNADSFGKIYVNDSTLNLSVGTGSFAANSSPFTKFLLDYAYIPSIDYGWNQEKVRVYDGSTIDAEDIYHDERFISLEFNLYDALNEDISHLMSSYDELNNFIGNPMNRYREDYEGLQQMRETYFKRLQGKLNFRVFVDMLDFFDSSFVSIVERLLPARSLFKGDELVVESHMLERPKYQYQLRPVIEGLIDISGSISIVDRGEDDF